MRRPSGIIIETPYDGGKVREYDTSVCLHCNKHSIAWKRQRPEDLPGGLCWTCGKIACEKCMKEMWNGKPCITLAERLQRASDQEYFRTRMKEW